jgi:acetyl esterase/lipase
VALAIALVVLLAGAACAGGGAGPSANADPTATAATAATGPTPPGSTPPGTTPPGSTPATVDCTPTGSEAHRDLPYRTVDGVDPNLVSLDLYLPVRPEGCGPVPLVVFVHGGGFATGDKANRIGDKVDLFTGAGWAFASVNYRLSTDPSAASGTPGAAEEGATGVRYPMHEQDVATAIAWLQDRAGTDGTDPKRVLLVGHSSGAYLVSLLGTDPTFLNEAGVAPASVRCIVALDTEYDATAQIAGGGNQEALYRNALGDDPAVWAAASPINHVGGAGPEPAFLVVTQGTPRRVEQATAFAAALEAAGTDASAIVVDPLSHEEVNAAVGAPGDTVVTPALMDFAGSCLGP